MSRDIVEQIVARAISDAAFRRQLQANPRAALRGFDLDPAETAALTSGDPKRLSALGVDQRMSRLFNIFGEASATHMSDADLSGGGAAVISSDGGDVTSLRTADLGGGDAGSLTAMHADTSGEGTVELRTAGGGEGTIETRTDGTGESTVETQTDGTGEGTVEMRTDAAPAVIGMHQDNLGAGDAILTDAAGSAPATLTDEVGNTLVSSLNPGELDAATNTLTDDVGNSIDPGVVTDVDTTGGPESFQP